jgi:hypothetical protein
MVSPETLLGIGVAIPVSLIGGYVAWVGRRVERLETERDGRPPRERDDAGG